MKHTWGNQKCI